MKLSRMILIGATLPFALLGDASSKSSVKAEECYLLGLQCVEGDGSVKDYAAAARFYRQAAEAGYAPAQYDLGFLYEKGWGVALSRSEGGRGLVSKGSRTGRCGDAKQSWRALRGGTGSRTQRRGGRLVVSGSRGAA